MTDCNTPFIPPTKVGSVSASPPLQYPLHTPSQTHPHTPKGFAHALRGDARPLPQQLRNGRRLPFGGFGGLPEEIAPRLCQNGPALTDWGNARGFEQTS